MTALPPIYYLHVWWSRRPLLASRAAVLASLLPADADRSTFMHMLGIHGDPVAAKKVMDKARRTGIRIDNPYGYDRPSNPGHEEIIFSCFLSYYLPLYIPGNSLMKFLYL